jgi:hypothetical protein
MEDTIKNTFTLPETKVVVKYIKRQKGMASGSHIGEDHVISGGMLSGSLRKFQVPLLKNGSLMNVLTKEEKAYLEDLTNLDLSVYGDFWSTHFVTLFKDDNLLDLSDPVDYISYKILLALKNDIAPSWKDRNNKQTYQFVVTNDSEELAEKKNKLDSKKEAFKLYGKIEDDKEKIIAILGLLTNKPISKDSKLDWLQTQLESVVDAKPQSFLDIIKDNTLDTKILIQSGITNKVIEKKGNKYSTIDGLDLCENGEIASYDNMVKYLENPKHQDVRTLIEAKVLKVKK